VLCYTTLPVLLDLKLEMQFKNVGKLQVRMAQSRYLQTKIRKYTASVETGFQIRGTLILRKYPCY